jgi:hypothetical protein
VRSGPSNAYYATGKLRYGDRVQIKGEKNGFLVIQPPAGSFSLVPRQSVQQQGDRIGVVTEKVDAIVGSALTHTMNVRGASLSRGSLVTILGEVTVPGEAGVARLYYQVEPSGEDRYIPAEAIQQSSLIQSQIAMPYPSFGESAGLRHTGPYANQLQRADLAYRQAQQTGDWRQAQRLYEELANSPDHEVRMIAWNRLEFIKKRPGPWSPPTGNPIPSSSRRASSTYAYSAEQWTAGGRLPPVPPSVAPVPAARPAPVASMAASRPSAAVSRPVDKPRAETTARPVAPAVQPPQPAVAAATLQSTGLGRLHRAMRTEQGRTLYYLEDSQGKVKCWASPAPGLNLDPFVEQIVELQGPTPVPRADLRGNHMTVVRVVPLNP